MPDALTDAQIIERLNRTRGMTRAAAGKALGVSPRSVSELWNQARNRGLTADTVIADETDKLKAKLAILEKDNRALRADHMTAAQIRETIYGIAQAPLDPPPWLGKTKAPGAPGVPMTMWSDWHWGEVVDPDQVGGANAFNREIAAARLRTLVDVLCDLALSHMVRPEYPGLVVCLGGDMITGDIHEELRETNEGTTMQSLLEVQDLLAGALDFLAGKFGRLFVPCVVGNHGRGTLKPRMKGRVYTSYEWNLYCQLERHFKKSKHVRFMIPNETDAYFKVYNHRFLLTHGDTLGVKGGDGIIGALGPIARGAMKVGRSEAQIGRDVDTILMGHWHTYIPRSEAVPVIVNGTLKGYDEYARLGLRVPYSPPSQALWFVHPTFGVTAQWRMQLEGRGAKDAPAWLTWQENG